MSEDTPAPASRRLLLVRNTAWNQAAQLVRMLSQFILLPFIVNRIGATEAGIYFLALSFTAYFGILDSSFSQPLIKFIAEYRATGEDDKLRASVRAVFRVFTGVGVVAAMLLGAAGIWALGILEVPQDQTSLARATFAVAAIASLATWPMTTYDNILRGIQRFDLVSKVSIVVTAVAFTGQLIAIASGLGPPVLIGITLASVAAGMSVSRYLARRELPQIRSGPGTPRSISKRLAGFAGTLFLIGLTDLVIYQVDRTVVSVTAGVAAVTIYEFAARFHKVPRDLHAIAVSAGMPAASELDAAGDRERLAKLMSDGTRFTVALVLPVTIAILALGRALTSSYAPPEAWAPLVIFTSYWVLNANTGIPSVILAGMGRLKVLLVYAYAVAALNLILSILLARRYGVSGVVAGTTISYALAFPVFLAISMRVIGVRFFEFAKRAWWPAYPMAAVLGGVLLLAAGPLARSGNFVLTAGSGAMAVGIYLAVFWAFAVTKDERKDFTDALTGKRQALPSESLTEEEIAVVPDSRVTPHTKEMESE
ncbi:MAG: hypothetical protein DCC49_04435 [Acidobacteria bacterium]|nr:MAG: hypothetical protein DCC49_04435 [Acidobacteriota bacterium]